MKKYLAFLIILTVASSCGSEENEASKLNEVIQEELPLREVKPKEYFIDLIKVDSAWMIIIEQKAKERNISVDEMLSIDADFLLEREAKVVKIENDIIRNQEWLDLVKKKAREQGINLEDMIRADATFMMEEKEKKENQ